MIKIAKTYSKVNEESAEYGDFCDHGFIVDGWEYSLNNEETAADIGANPDRYKIPWKVGSLRDAVQWAIDNGVCNRSSSDVHDGIWWTSEAEQDYSTGEYTEVSLHIDGVTLSTLKRIDRLLGAR
jgi:hypothetical protein